MASHLSSEKPFSLDYSKNIFLMFILSGQKYLAFLAAHCPIQAEGRDNVPTQVWSLSRIGRFLLGLPEVEKDLEKWSSAGEAGVPWVKCKHTAGWAQHRVHIEKHCYLAEGLGSHRGLLDRSQEQVPSAEPLGRVVVPRLGNGSEGATPLLAKGLFTYSAEKQLHNLFLSIFPNIS